MSEYERRGAPRFRTAARRTVPPGAPPPPRALFRLHGGLAHEYFGKQTTSSARAPVSHDGVEIGRSACLPRPFKAERAARFERSEEANNSAAATQRDDSSPAALVNDDVASPLSHPHKVVPAAEEEVQVLQEYGALAVV